MNEIWRMSNAEVRGYAAALKQECRELKTENKITKRTYHYDMEKKDKALTLCVEIGKKIEEESIDQSIEPGYQIEPDSQQALISLELLRGLFKALKAAKPFMKKEKETEQPHCPFCGGKAEVIDGQKG